MKKSPSTPQFLQTMNVLGSENLSETRPNPAVYYGNKLGTRNMGSGSGKFWFHLVVEKWL